MKHDDEFLLRDYVQHHLVGSKGGLDLLKRAATSQRDPGVREQLGEIARQVTRERSDLAGFAERLGASKGRGWQLLAGFGETLGRLKPNGTLFRRSPLSDLVELEMLVLGVEGKKCGWISMLEASRGDDRLDRGKLESLIESANDQLERLESMRRATAARLFRGTGGPAA
ncbi:hypothetical protein NBM05_09395 [Rothia sp. AR01]|uniref:Uncharacterized protein n=1 Tax=Rothia santali TaxID=2949643 RepID=A0A9X2HDP7_9MICC|nr:hypothetical protein [Rothia santali]MCP3426215.1 hypothetical protein [Rothia santali]